MNYANLQNEVLNEVFETIYRKEDDFWEQFKKTEVLDVIKETLLPIKEISIEISKNKIIIDSSETFNLQDDHLFEHLIVTNESNEGGTTLLFKGYLPSQFRLNLIKNIFKKVCEIRYLKGYVLVLPPTLISDCETIYEEHYSCLNEGNNRINNAITIYNFNQLVHNVLYPPQIGFTQAACYSSLIGYYTDDFVHKVEHLGSFIEDFINDITDNYLISRCEALYEKIISRFSRFTLSEKIPAFTMFLYTGQPGAELLEVENKGILFVFKFLYRDHQLFDYLNGYVNTSPLYVTVRQNKEQIAILKKPTINDFKDYSLSFKDEEDGLELLVADNSYVLTRFIKNTTKVDFENKKSFNSRIAFSYLASRFNGSPIELLQILNKEEKSLFEIVYCQQQNEKHIYDKIVLKIYTKDKSSCSVLFISHNKSTDVFEYESSTSGSETSIFSFIR